MAPSLPTTFEEEDTGVIGTTVIEDCRTTAVIEQTSLGTHWTVLGELGSFGQVFSTRHHQWEKEVAVKIICLDDGRPDKELFKAAEVMLHAEGPYIMKILGIFKGYRPMHCMVFVGLITDMAARGSLFSMQKKRGDKLLPWPLVFRLVHQVAEGMKTLHGLTPSLIHKDLKPANVLLDEDLNVKITDFNLDMLAHRETVRPLRGVQTHFFNPPEATTYEVPTCAYDVYSYALLVWTILNPDHSYPKFDVENGARPSLEEVDKMKAEVPGLEELVALMVRCWSQDQEERPTFAECAAVTEGLYQKHEHGIADAVRKVLKELDAAPVVKAVVITDVKGFWGQLYQNWVPDWWTGLMDDIRWWQTYIWYMINRNVKRRRVIAAKST